MEITAAVTREKGADFSLERVQIDDPRSDEILVRVVAVGLCHTDLVARDQILPLPLPAVFGHEAAGVVERIGSGVTKVAPGDHVVLTFRSCGTCARCAAGEPAYCERSLILNYTGARPDGTKALRSHDHAISSNFFGQSSFASYALAYERNVVKVETDAPLELLGPLGCGIQTGAGAVMRSLACPAGSSLLVLGGGSVGLSAVMAAAAVGCSPIIVSDPLASRRALAIELGATDVIDPDDGDLAAAVRAIVPGGADFALDTTGNETALNAAMKCLRPRGTLGLTGVPHNAGMRLPGTVTETLIGGLSVRGIIEGDSDPDTFIPELIALRRQGRFPFDRLIATYSFDQINTAVADQRDGVITKAVLVLPHAN